MVVILKQRMHSVASDFYINRELRLFYRSIQSCLQSTYSSIDRRLYCPTPIYPPLKFPQTSHGCRLIRLFLPGRFWLPGL